MKLYIIENGRPVEYERKGHCLGCGQCCRRRIDFEWEVQMPGRHNHRDDAKEDVAPDWYAKYNGWSFIRALGAWWWFHVKSVAEREYDPDKLCEHFCSETNRCDAFKDLQDFGQLCWFWPVHPDNLERFPRCGFSFKRIQTEQEATHAQL